MKRWKNLKLSVAGISHSLLRFPITALWLVALAVINTIQIENEQSSYGRLLFTCLVGAMLGVVAEHLYERFFEKESYRWILLGSSIVLAFGYSFLLPNQDFEKAAYFIRTFVLLFSLFIAFIWIPSIHNSKIFFHQSFFATLKAGFITFLFAGVLTVGIIAIIAAIERLFFAIDENVFLHIGNLIWTLFAPMYFLTLLPQYIHKKNKPLSEGDAGSKSSDVISGQKTLENPFNVPRFMEVLLTYIVIPLTALYTVILLAYVITNIGGEFWTDNLLEPMLVSYAIIVIIVYLISCNVDNKITNYFRKIFPKIMLPIVLFQTISSILKIQEMGITYGRYYVILFGIFATIAGVVFSFLPPSKNGWIALTLLVLAFVSVIPPIDAFTIAPNSQLSLLKETLLRNGMLENDHVVAKNDISTTDKVLISRSITALYEMDELDRANYLPEPFDPYSRQMESTFGFPYTYQENQYNGNTGRSAYLEWQNGKVISLDGADYMIRYFVSSSDPSSQKPIEIKSSSEGGNYTLETEYTKPYYQLRLLDEQQRELLAIDLTNLFKQAFDSTEGKTEVTQEDMTWTEENEKAKITIVAMSLDEYKDQTNADLFLYIDIK